MAECSFSRCVQERRVIKKELQRWTKNMVVVVGLERVAEELMGRRKWKQCQNAISASEAAASADATGTTLFESSIAVAPEETKDWTPPEKCNLCNEKSLLLDRAPSPGSELDSSSNDSVYRESPPPAFHPRTPPAMTAYESVKLAAIAALSHSPDGGVMSPNMFYPPSHHGGLFTPWYLPPHLSARASTPHALEVPVQQPMIVKEEVAVGAEMPLDLSAKAVDSQSIGVVPQSLRVPSVDSKQIYKAKPRMSAVAGRRTYTEDELQAALRDIQSGKLGTRRAAVIYGIPRSTLRNKVYKLAMERERDAQLLLSAPTPPPASMLKRGVGDDDDKELSGAEEEREVEKALRKPLLSMEDLVRFSMLESNGLANPEAIRNLLTQSKMEGRFPFPPGDAWGGLEHSALGPYISQLLAAGKAQEAEGNEFVPKFSPPLLPELVRRMMAEEKMLMESHAKRNGSVEHEPRPSSSANRAATAAAASVGDDDNSDTDATPSNVILKIPSFKPTSSSSKNGTASEPFPSPTQESSSQPGYNGADSRSPPSMIGKGIGVSLRDVIAKSISQKFQQGGEMVPMPLSQKLLLSPDAESPFKRGRFSPPMSHLQAHHAAIKHNNNNHHMDHDRNVQKMSPTGKSSMLSQTHAAAGGGGGGKGTRPKRGKYRNYDRDSLVEAVRAVQRGEMSVHRAGSYYGVPHSTLEYKVKERHLMRPRKRDPKPPLDEPKRKDDLRLGSPQDKPGVGVGVGPKLLKPPFPTSPLQNPANGLKIPPMFDPAMSPLAYSTPPPFPFWPPNPFHGMPMPEFPRGPNAHEQFIASHMMQRLQEGSRLPGHGAHAMLNAPPPDQPQLGTNVRKIAESLYDGTGTNGNFLDGIIRSSLEMGLPLAGKEGGVSERAPENLSNKALLDQLCRNSRITPLPVHDGSTSEDESGKRSSVDGKDDTRMDFSPSSDDSARKDRDRHMDDDFDSKSGKDRFSEQGSPVSKDSRDEFSDNDARMEEESACDSKDNVQRSTVEETPVKEEVREGADEQQAVEEAADEDDDADEARSQSTETKTNIDLKSD